LKCGSKGVAKRNRWRDDEEEIPDLSGAEFNRATLSEANLSTAHLSNAKLTNADLSRADLIGADLHAANLHAANLRRANLIGAIANGTIVRLAILNDAVCGFTIFARVELSEAKGLDSVKQFRPSTIGIDALFRSRGKVPEAFLRGCCVQDRLITYLPSIIGSMSPIQFYS
jgi:hypothetical protein